MKYLLGLVLTLAVVVNCEEFEECAGKPNEQFIADPNSCSAYIYCGGTESFKDECPDGLYYDQENFMCDDPAKVDCVLEEATKTTASTTQILTSSSGQTTSAAASSSSSSSSLSTTSTQTPQTLSTLTTTLLTSPPTTPARPTIGTVTTTFGSTIRSTIETTIGTICPASNNNQPESVPKPGSCRQYYLCYNGTPILMECPMNLEFSNDRKQCDWPSDANCVLDSATTLKPFDVCKSQGNGFFKYPDNCRYYYRCTNGMLSVQECPTGYGWDDSRRSCTPNGC